MNPITRVRTWLRRPRHAQGPETGGDTGQPPGAAHLLRQLEDLLRAQGYKRIFTRVDRDIGVASVTSGCTVWLYGGRFHAALPGRMLVHDATDPAGFLRQLLSNPAPRAIFAGTVPARRELPPAGLLPA